MAAIGLTARALLFVGAWMSEYQDLGEYLKQARLRKGLSRADMVKLMTQFGAPVSESALERIETGKSLQEKLGDKQLMRTLARRL